MRNVQIKICGLTSAADAETMNRFRPDYAGIVLFYPRSKRNRTPEQARQILAALHPSVRPVAVVVSPTEAELRQIGALGFFAVQIHGAAPDGLLERCPLPVWKAFQEAELTDFDRYRRNPKITGYVFDAAQPGSGRTFDWNRLQALPRDGKLRLLAGGLTPENAAAAIAAARPDGLDVSSGVEYADGRPGKDAARVEAFLRAARGETQSF